MVSKIRQTAWIGDELMELVSKFAKEEIGIGDPSIVYLLIRKAILFSMTEAKEEFKEFLRRP